MTAPIVMFDVYGTPAPQGSKKAYVRGTRAVLVESSVKVPAWRDAVVHAALTARDGAPTLDGPLVCQIVFYLRRPQSEPKTRVTWPQRKPDLDKLIRSTFDALTTAGVWTDDSRVVDVLASKRWADNLRSEGARIRVSPCELVFALARC